MKLYKKTAFITSTSLIADPLCPCPSLNPDDSRRLTVISALTSTRRGFAEVGKSHLAQRGKPIDNDCKLGFMAHGLTL